MREIVRGGTLVLGCVLAIVVATPAHASLVAPGSDCPGQQNRKASEHQQEEAMRCLINHARRKAGVGGLRKHRALERAAGLKSRDIDRCGFSHTACGHPADSRARQTGYTDGARSWAWGENLARGQGKRGTARAVLKAWLDSPPHRDTLLTRRFEHSGIGLRGGRSATWVLEVGCRGC